MVVIGIREEDKIEGLTFKYPLGDHVKYQGKMWMIFKHEKKNGGPAYLLDLLEDDTTFIDNVAESELEECDMKCACCFEFIEECWNRFVYTGDNGAASNWLIKNLTNKISGVNGVEFHHNEDNTEYSLVIKHSDTEQYSWVKTKTN